MKGRIYKFSKHDLVKLIVQAGLEEDFMKWLSERGYNHIFGRLDNVPQHLIVSYVESMKLLDMGEEEYKMYYEQNIDELDIDVHNYKAGRYRR